MLRKEFLCIGLPCHAVLRMYQSLARASTPAHLLMLHAAKLSRPWPLHNVEATLACIRATFSLCSQHSVVNKSRFNLDLTFGLPQSYALGANQIRAAAIPARTAPHEGGGNATPLRGRWMNRSLTGALTTRPRSKTTIGIEPIYPVPDDPIRRTTNTADTYFFRFKVRDGVKGGDEDNEIKIMKFFDYLDSQAIREGGRVLPIKK